MTEELKALIFRLGAAAMRKELDELELVACPKPAALALTPAPTTAVGPPPERIPSTGAGGKGCKGTNRKWGRPKKKPLADSKPGPAKGSKATYKRTACGVNGCENKGWRRSRSGKLVCTRHYGEEVDGGKLDITPRQPSILGPDGKPVVGLSDPAIK